MTEAVANTTPVETNPSIVILKTGDKLITFLQEVFEGEGEDRKGVCLVMNYPYELALVSSPSPDNTVNDLQVKFSKWCPYALDSSYRIAYDGILTIGTPDPGLADAYRKKVEQAKEIELTNSKNAELQQEAIQEVLKSNEAGTAGVGADTSKHPIGEPLQQVDEEPAVTPEVV
jgi:hypothetical protein|tara:strand:+ start:306 stop:824 length:519 start_codon:yes stop_codon:yes gene_type:complete